MAEQKKRVVKLAELANLARPIDISDTQQIMVRALTLREMVTLFIEARDTFLGLYAVGLKSDATAEEFAPFLITAPDVVAKIIALASDEPDNAEMVETRMPGTVQLIALFEIWHASVPDPKKARELLSEVTTLLQTANASVGPSNPSPEPTPSVTMLPAASNS
jgi:hypothetical protein